ncbi:MAG: polysaccharide biosynthesis/export family protein [Saprospiraceae bacterium]
MGQIIKYCFLLISFAFLVSCETYDPLFQHKIGQNVDTFQNNASVEPIIRVGDKVTVSIWGHEDLSVGSINSPFSSNEATGRWLIVDKTGEVNLPRIGRVKLDGYNLKEANYFLENLYERNGIKDPIVNVRILSHFVTLIGEISIPGRYQIDNETITLIELLGKAEGLTKYAKADEVHIVRKTVNGEMQEVIVDLTNFASLSENNYVLTPDDIIYIPPSKMKKVDNTLEKLTPVAGILTSVAVIFSVFFQ